MSSVNLAHVVGAGYKDFWSSKKRYRVLKGGRASKKSKTSALWFIYNLIKYSESNILVVRQTYNTHRDSTFADLKWAAKQLQVYDLFKFTTQPLEITYKPTGQKILFRGFDDVMKLTSISVDTGYLCWVWLEEAYEIESESDFRTLDECIRGEMPDNLWKQITLTYNPWVNSHWTKQRFFDNKDPDADTFTTTYKDNEWLDDADKKLIEDLKTTDPERYLVVGLGEYGIPGGAFFPEFRKSIHTIAPFEIPNNWSRYRSLDYGLDMTACYWIAVDEDGLEYVYRELYEPNMILSDAAKKIVEYTGKENIICTYASPDLWNRRQETGQSGAEIMMINGLYGMQPANNRRVEGWRILRERLKNVKTRYGDSKALMRIFSTCHNLIRCLPQLSHDEKKIGDCKGQPHEITHAPEAMRYYAASVRVSIPYTEATDNKFSEETFDYADTVNCW